MSSQLTCNLTIGESFVQITTPRMGQQLTVKQHGELSDNEYAAANAIVEVMRALNVGQNINRYFNPAKIGNSKMVKCRWSRHGHLKLIDEKPDKKYQHATTIEEAINRNRTFTCDITLYEELPKKRLIHNEHDITAESFTEENEENNRVTES